MKAFSAPAAGLAFLAMASVAEAANPFPYRYRWTDPSGYTYYTPSDIYLHPGYGYGSRVSGYIPRPWAYYGYDAALPPVGYTYGYRGYGYGYDLPPYGFGSRYYSGYNDPLLPTYGPGVQEFLLYGGADFYGW